MVEEIVWINRVIKEHLVIIMVTELRMAEKILFKISVYTVLI